MSKEQIQEIIVNGLEFLMEYHPPMASGTLIKLLSKNTGIDHTTILEVMDSYKGGYIGAF